MSKTIKIISLISSLSILMCGPLCAMESVVDGPRDEVMGSKSVYHRPEGSEECFIDRRGCSSPFCESCKEAVESSNSVCNGGPSVGYIEEKDPCCALVYGISFFPLNVIWRSLTCPWQVSMDCCARNRALYTLCGKEEGTEVKTKRFTMKYVRHRTSEFSN